MKFCANLFRDINFEPNAIQPCCNTRAIAHLPRFPFSGGRQVDMGAYQKHLAQSLVAMQEPGGMCAGCDRLMDIEVPEETNLRLKIVFKTISFNMHRHMCNCRCVYCNLWRMPDAGYEVLPVIKNLEAQKALDKNCFFSWGGGEPTILKEFEKASGWIGGRGYFQYVYSNALRFSPVLAELLARGNTTLNVSLDSGSSEVYRAVKGVDGFDKVTANIAAYAEKAASPEAIELKYIVFEKNNSREEIERFFTFCKICGIRRVQLSLNFLEVNAGTLSESTLDAAAWFLYRAFSLKMQYEPHYISDTLFKRLAKRAELIASQDRKLPLTQP